MKNYHLLLCLLLGSSAAFASGTLSNVICHSRNGTKVILLPRYGELYQYNQRGDLTSSVDALNLHRQNGANGSTLVSARNESKDLVASITYPEDNQDIVLEMSRVPYQCLAFDHVANLTKDFGDKEINLFEDGGVGSVSVPLGSAVRMIPQNGATCNLTRIGSTLVVVDTQIDTDSEEACELVVSNGNIGKRAVLHFYSVGS